MTMYTEENGITTMAVILKKYDVRLVQEHSGLYETYSMADNGLL